MAFVTFALSEILDLLLPPSLGVLRVLLSWLNVIVLLVFFVPLLALLVRRFHDVNLSGWWCLAAILVMYGPIVFNWNNFATEFSTMRAISGSLVSIAVFLVTVLPSTDGANGFGDNPNEFKREFTKPFE